MGDEMNDRLGTVARVIASGWTASFLLLAIGYAFVDDPNQSEDVADLLMDTMLMAVFLAAAVGGCVLSWARTSLSFALFVAIGIAGAAMGAVTAGENHLSAALISGGPYFVAAAVAWFSPDSPRSQASTDGESR